MGDFVLDPGLWGPQSSACMRIMDAVSKGKDVLLQSPTGSGKCLAPDTPVMLFSGDVVRACDVKAGQLLMGPDSKPRRVLSTCRGRGEMYRVTPTKGDAYVVNDVHILTLRMNANAGGYKKGEFVDISIPDYFAKSKSFRHCAKGFRCNVMFPSRGMLRISPYYMGLWLGDGARKDYSLTIGDKDLQAIMPYIKREAEAFGVEIKEGRERGACRRFYLNNGRGGSRNPLSQAFVDLGLGQKKFVPDVYKFASRRDRLELIAGLVDTDGYMSGSGCYDWVSKDKQLAEDLVFLCRSVGLAAYMSVKTVDGVPYYRLSISGETSMIPCRTRKRAPKRKINKDVRSVGIKVEPIGEGPYAGFELDGDGRFLLGDFTVTHNTRVSIETMRWAKHHGKRSVFYVNRKLLIGQTADRMRDLGHDYGIRAADFPEKYDASPLFQIASAQTELARVYGPEDSDDFRPQWDPCDADLVIVDEAHIQKGRTMERILDDHRSRGAKVIKVSATPVAIGGPDYEMIVAGTLKDFRDAGALVPAHTYSISQPDLDKVKRSQTGEYVMDATQKKVFTQHIVGDVISNWKKYNPDGRPCMLYAPGKPDSLWFAQQFEKEGVRWCHVDATEAWLDGRRYKLNRKMWDEILEQYEDGSILGISSRFKLREGVDVPSTYQIILATPIGSLASYLQTVGRGLRAAPNASYAKDHCLVQDHGGNYWRHGSANEERDWDYLSSVSDYVASTQRVNDYRNNEEREPIRCPNCFFERTSGMECPNCKHQHERGVRAVVQEGGELKLRNGRLTKLKQRQRRNNTQDEWDKMYWGYKRKKLKKSFHQMEAYFCQVHGYYPKRELNNMPVNKADWYRDVHSVSYADLRKKK